MTTVSINLALLERAAERANKVQDKLGDYADEIPGIVNTPLASLEGGSSGYTSTAASRASAKARSLDSRASDYAALSQHIDSFVGAVRQADANVEKRIVAITSPYVDAMSFWQRVSYYFDAAFNDVLGSTLVGKFMNALHNAYEVAVDMREDALRSVRDYFKYGDGKYVLNIAISALAAIGAVATFILSFPVSGVFTAFLAGCAFVGAVVAAADFGFTVYSNIEALSLNSTEPGLAHYYGSVDSVSDWANKTSTNATWRNIAYGVDMAGKIAGLASFFGGTFTKRLADGTLVSSFSWSTVKSNLLGKIGVSYSSSKNGYVFKPSTIFGFKTGSSAHIEGSSNATWFHTAETVRNIVTPSKNITQASQQLIDGVDSPDAVLNVIRKVSPEANNIFRLVQN